MKIIVYFLLGGVLLVAIANAQQAPSFDGTWKGIHKIRPGSDLEVQLVIKGQSGTWQWERKSGKWSWPCAGYEFPVVLQDGIPTELTFRIESEKIVKGCGEAVVSLKLVDENRTLEGTFKKSGTSVKLTRQ